MAARTFSSPGPRQDHPSGQHLAPAGRNLPPAVQAKMESALGHDFSQVRIHEGGSAESRDGAHFGITGIHSLLGNIGQSNIGALFNSAHAQALLGQSIRSPANRQLGGLEHGFWLRRLLGEGAHGTATLGERFGGLMGAAFPEPARAGIQTLGNTARTLAPRLALRIPTIAGIAGGLGLAERSMPEEWREQLSQRFRRH